MPRVSGITPIASDQDYATVAELLAGVERALLQVETTNLRDDLLDIAAVYRAALDGYRAGGPTANSTGTSTEST